MTINKVHKVRNRIKSANQYKDTMTPYIKMIEAIIQSGRMENDQSFLSSKWYQYLWDWYVTLWQDYSQKSEKISLTSTFNNCRFS